MNRKAIIISGLMGSLLSPMLGMVAPQTPKKTRGKNRYGVRGRFYDTVRPEVRAAWDANRIEYSTRQQRRVRHRKHRKEIHGRRWREYA